MRRLLECWYFERIDTGTWWAISLQRRICLVFPELVRGEIHGARRFRVDIRNQG